MTAAPEVSPVRNRLLLVGAALLFSTGGAAIKAATLNGWQVASFRSGVAAVVLLALLPEARRGWTWRLAPVGVAYAATLILFVLATRMTTAANAIFLQSTSPLYLLLLGPWLLHEPVKRSDLVYVLAVAGGMALLFRGTEQALATAPDPHRGNLLGAASGLAWALTVTGLRWLGRSEKGNAALAPVVAGNFLAFLVALPMALPLTRISGADVAVILYLGIIQIGLAYVCVTRAIRHVPAFEATTVLLLEPVMNPIWAWLVQAERPGAWALAGGAVILSATLFNTWRQARRLRGRDYAPVGR
ncbi:MAG TPA: DMT family transporter [Bryobacteraceae bacterium]|nr:DMT family transporter [Bryobacteraceae bacterium]